ncbi:Flp family type IVb pilin [Vibrio sp. CB1-14]|uniref:Flp family type IVb pilin n=1 Tax=Vibrio chaetopteri TaxID=3016528 RepID=A0AAU8BFM3_9VIBR
MMTKLYVNAVTLLNEFKRDERGVTAIEYGLIGVAMAVALTAIFATGTDGKDFISQLTATFTSIGAELEGASE